MNLNKMKNKKTVTALVTVFLSLLASFGVDLGSEINNLIRDVAISFLGGAGAGSAFIKRQINKKLEENVFKMEAGADLVNGKINSLSAKAKAEYGRNFGAFIETELNPVKDELKALTGIEWKF